MNEHNSVNSERDAVTNKQGVAMKKDAETGSQDSATDNHRSVMNTQVTNRGHNSAKNERTGCVYLVGAGPGDPDLLTIKGRQAVEKADVIVYDQLISTGILRHAREDCECMFVGKSPGRHYRLQQEINDLLVGTASKGRIVVRLKGGDPFVFGRGGEEAAALKEKGIAFEVIPGVTSAIAVPAYAGIPVTHRGLSSSFMVLAGHEDPLKLESSIAWEHISKTTGTLVFLMGMANLSLIIDRLMDNGMSADTPVAVIENGASPRQRTVCGELSSIVSLARQHSLSNPAIIVVGQVVSLREELQWFETRQLFGQRIMVTRARQQVSKLSAALSELGANVFEMPVIAFQAPSRPAQLSKAIQELGVYSWLVFTSVNGVEAFFAEMFSQAVDVRQLAGITLVAIGPATQKALEARGLRGIIVPDEYCAEGIVDKMDGLMAVGERVLLVRAEQARDILPQTLADRGALVTEVAAYQTRAADLDTEALVASLRAKEFDAITFTSSSTVHNFMKCISGDTMLLSDVTLCSIGPITSDTLRVYGLVPGVEATDYCIEGLVEAIVEKAVG